MSLAHHDWLLAAPARDVIAHNSQGTVLRRQYRYDEALASFDTAIALMPRFAPSHYHRGLTLQNMHRYHDSLLSYDTAIALEPDFGEACFNRGMVLHALGRYEQSLASYERAIALKPDRAGAAYHMRGMALHQLHRDDKALADYDQAMALGHDSAEVLNDRGITLHALVRHDEALASYDQAIALVPEHALAHSNRAVTLEALGRYDEALASIDRALALKPGFAEGLYNRGNILQKFKRYDEALEAYDQALASNPNFADAYNNRGTTLQQLARYDEALASIDRAVALKPANAGNYNNRGEILADQGHLQRSEAAFLQALTLNPCYPKALYNLAHIRQRDTLDHAFVTQARSLLEDESRSDAEYLYFSLGKVHDDCGRYDEAFEYYRQANRICSAKVRYDANRLSQVARRMIDIFSQRVLARQCAFASISRQPVFIVGMPRSGTTLIANILSRHPAISTAGELPTMAECCLHLQESLGGQDLASEADEQVPAGVACKLIADYEQRLQRDAGPDAPWIIDKHPLNFWNLGLISVLFPQARIIHCTRHPLDTCLSNFFQCFAFDYDYAFELENLAHYYQEYVCLMEHWRSALPTPMIEVAYEETVKHTEDVARRLLQAIGADWDDRCLAPHANSCAVGTASRWQVRQPIYTRSLQRWRHYERHLGPLQEIMHPAPQKLPRAA